MPFDLTKYAESAKKDTIAGFDLSKYAEPKEGKSLWGKYWEAEKFLGKEAAGFVKRSIQQAPELIAGLLEPIGTTAIDRAGQMGQRQAELKTQQIVEDVRRKAAGEPEPSWRKGPTMQALGQIPFAGVIPRAISDPKETLYEKTFPTLVEAGVLFGMGRGLFRGRGRPTEVPKAEVPPVEPSIPKKIVVGEGVAKTARILREQGVGEAGTRPYKAWESAITKEGEWVPPNKATVETLRYSIKYFEEQLPHFRKEGLNALLETNLDKIAAAKAELVKRGLGVTEQPPPAPAGKVVEPPVTPPAKPPPPDTKVRGLAKHIEDKAIETGLTKGFEGLPEYDVMSMKEQAGRAATLIANEPVKAKRIAMGEAPPEGGVTAEMVMVGIERAALEAGDVGTIRDLALNSRLMTEATEMGQRIRTLGERDPTSPVGAIQGVAKAREKVVRRKITNVEAVRERTVNDLRTQIKRARPTRQTWEQFIESIRC